MLYTTAAGPESARAFVSQAFPASFVDGLALVVPPGMEDYMQDLKRQRLPVVVIDDRGDHPEFPAVATTNLDGGLAATRHLIGLGRRRIAMINGPVDYGCNRDRLEGYRGALAEAGHRFDRHLVAQGDFSEASGDAAMQTLLKAGRAIDAVFVANDQMAFGAMRALRRAGRTIPDDVAVVGFDDLPASALTHPSLTTVRQPLYEMGRTAAAMLMAAVRGEPVEKRVELATELIVRSSTAGSAAPVTESAGG
jgi:LacI family transcriptional regulator